MIRAGTEKSNLYCVFAALLGLLVLTVGFSFVNLGSFNMVVALTIAVAKALLVVTYFMELRRSSRLLWVVAGAGVLWLLILIGGTLADVMTRSLPAGLL